MLVSVILKVLLRLFLVLFHDVKDLLNQVKSRNSTFNLNHLATDCLDALKQICENRRNHRKELIVLLSFLFVVRLFKIDLV